tara:strand:+ start:272 stop:760 length:489 start_codon:yes stop_codon:yes gene_type:complete
MKKKDDALLEEVYTQIYHEGIIDRTKARASGISQYGKNIFADPEDRRTAKDASAGSINSSFIANIDNELANFNSRLGAALDIDDANEALRSLGEKSPELTQLYASISDIVNNIKQVISDQPAAPATPKPAATATPKPAEPVHSKIASDGGREWTGQRISASQ